MSQELVTHENAKDVIAEIEDAFWDIPFENSTFQTEAFVIAAQITPERAYRAIGLRLHDKLTTLLDVKYKRMLREVEKDELTAKTKDMNLSPYDRRRAEIELLKITDVGRMEDKLINDALRELNTLYAHFKKLPRYTREQFEAAERTHYEQRLARQVQGLSGAAESLVNMKDDMAAIANYEEKVAALPHTNESLLLALQQMENVLQIKYEEPSHGHQQVGA